MNVIEPMNLTELLRQVLVLHQQVRDYQVQALLSGSLDQVAAIRRQESLARQERRRLCGLVRGEVRLRLDAWDHGREYSQIESTKRFTARRGTRGK
jgi:hypothetical protein